MHDEGQNDQSIVVKYFERHFCAGFHLQATWYDTAGKKLNTKYKIAFHLFWKCKLANWQGTCTNGTLSHQENSQFGIYLHVKKLNSVKTKLIFLSCSERLCMNTCTITPLMFIYAYTLYFEERNVTINGFLFIFSLISFVWWERWFVLSVVSVVWWLRQRSMSAPVTGPERGPVPFHFVSLHFNWVWWNG